MPLRFGPRHCGQSPAEVVTESAEQHKQSVARVASNRDFTVDLLLALVITLGLPGIGRLRIHLRKCFVRIPEAVSNMDRQSATVFSHKKHKKLKRSAKPI